MTELKNCPFCGGEPLQGKHWVTWCDREYVVACECGAARSGDTKSEAITAWNTRTDGWQDIADAPRDGTEADLWLAPMSEAGTPLIPCRVPNCWWEDGFWWTRAESDIDQRITQRVTHFMPLPTPPENVT